ncbi:hypothetical protein MINTM001_10720 [Mycobacterium paraintracellulare]|uniref:DUF6262 family protein n=1 Tax=Mycobacterium paraintracellulare TaxID=1138383 RepID=UPI001926122A|nr:DUF6262 family protein [Mycobacterium paraintracellulare]BCO39933.1 hypothetical protein MINTM001_10720 [Mycobacterium paraintracellulare]
MSTREARIETLAAANAARHKKKREAVDTALKNFRHDTDRLTVSAVASRAGVSRNFVYSQADVMQEIRAAAHQQSDRMFRPQPSASTEASLRKRLTDALDALEDNKRVIANQRATIERLTGELARRMSSAPTTA